MKLKNYVSAFAPALVLALALIGCGQDCQDQYECLVLGQAYSNGNVVPKNETKGLKLINDACQMKNGQACHELALRAKASKTKGETIDPSISTNENLACDYGYGAACYELASNALNDILEAVKNSGVSSVQISNIFSGIYSVIKQDGSVEAVIQNRAKRKATKATPAQLTEDTSVAKSAKEDVAQGEEKAESQDQDSEAKDAVPAENNLKIDGIVASQVGLIEDLVFYVDKACASNYGDGCYYLGLFYNAVKDPQMEEVFKKSCELNSSDGCTVLGLLLEEQGKIDASLYVKGCVGGNSEGCFRAGKLLIQNKDNDIAQKGMPYLERACALNGSWCSTIAQLFKKAERPDLVSHFAGKLCEDKHIAAECGKLSDMEFAQNDVGRASMHASIGCELNDAYSCAIYSLLFLNNPQKLQAFSFKACELGSALGCEVLSYSLYREGKLEKAFGTASSLCAQGDNDACAIALRVHVDDNKYGTKEQAKDFAAKACALKKTRWNLLTPEICQGFTPKVETKGDNKSNTNRKNGKKASKK